MNRSTGILMSVMLLVVAALNVLSLMDVIDISDRLLKSITFVVLIAGAVFLAVHQGRARSA